MWSCSVRVALQEKSPLGAPNFQNHLFHSSHSRFLHARRFTATYNLWLGKTITVKYTIPNKLFVFGTTNISAEKEMLNDEKLYRFLFGIKFENVLYFLRIKHWKRNFYDLQQDLLTPIVKISKLSGTKILWDINFHQKYYCIYRLCLKFYIRNTCS